MAALDPEGRTVRLICLRGLVGSLLLLVGGTLMTRLPDSVARSVFAPLLGHSGRAPGVVLSTIGLALLAWAWLSLMAACRDGTSPASALRVVRSCTAVWVLPLLIAPPLFSRDGWSYAAQGVLTSLGISPYEHGPGWLDGPLIERVDPLWMFTPAPYGPVSLTWGAWGSNLTHDPYLLVVWHRLAAVAGLAMLAWAVPRLATWCGQSPALASAAVLASPFMLAHGVASLHNDLLAAGVGACALALATTRPWIAAALGGLAAAVKLPAGVVCVGIALLVAGPSARLLNRLRSLARVALVASAALLVAGLPYGLGVGWLNTLGTPGKVRTPLSPSTDLGTALESLTSFGPNGGPYGWELPLARTVGVVLMAAALVFVALRAETGRPASAVRAVAVSGLAMCWLAPVVHAWYLLWALPFLAALRLSAGWFRVLVVFLLAAGLTAPLFDIAATPIIAIVVALTFATQIAIPRWRARATATAPHRRSLADAWLVGAAAENDQNPRREATARASIRDRPEI